MSMTLQHLAQGIAEVPQTAAELVIEGLTSDSRKAGEGFVFVAIPGELADGASFGKAAVARALAASKRWARCSANTSPIKPAIRTVAAVAAP